MLSNALGFGDADTSTGERSGSSDTDETTATSDSDEADLATSSSSAAATTTQESTDSSAPSTTSGTTTSSSAPVVSDGLPASSESVFLGDVGVLRYDGSCKPDFESATLGTGTFPRSVVWRSACSGQEVADFLLDGRFVSFVGVAGFATASEIESSSTLEVHGDGRVLGSFALRYGKSVPILVDVSGVLQLRLVVVDNDRGEIQVIGDAQLLGV